MTENNKKPKHTPSKEEKPIIPKKPSKTPVEYIKEDKDKPIEKK